jgi:NADH:ubiquinone oxidoreductase subunit D
MHRGYEKLSEVRTYPQINTLVNRIDWVGSFANEVPFILAAEQLMEIEAPPRAQWIRTVLFELSRLANIILFLGDMGVQLGALTPVFYAFRDREYVLNQIEAVTGGRFHPNFDRIGGLKDDLPKGWVDDTKSVMHKVRDFCDLLDELLLGNEIFESRTRGIGVIPAEVGLSYGLTGANWHERETWEMYGITFVGHPHLVHIYLPGGFEGNPLRKDFPLLAREVKPWPGIVDVEPMPDEGDGDDAEAETTEGEEVTA